MNYDKISNEINDRYLNKPHRKRLAEKCLDKAKEWLEEFSKQNDISNLSKSDYKKIKKDCATYIKNSINTEEEEKVYGSVLFVIVIGAIISWLIQRLLDEMFDKE